VRVPAVNPCAIHGVRPSVVHAACIRGDRMLNGKQYFESFPDEEPAPLECGTETKCPSSLTAELRSALEDLKKYFQQFLSGVAE
jgi:hypothetical protein